jgi:8-oxo-dGTP pyrophosphatase MutT (NUDIX family)
MLSEKSCGAVVCLRKNSEILYLLLHYEAGHWDFVKGNVEPNETEKETVVRELREETGITDAKFLEGFKERIEYYYRRQGDTVRKEVIFFLMETSTENIIISFEHIGSVWLDYQHAMERLTFKNAKEVLKKADRFLKSSLNGYFIKP